MSNSKEEKEKKNDSKSSGTNWGKVAVEAAVGVAVVGVVGAGLSSNSRELKKESEKDYPERKPGCVLTNDDSSDDDWYNKK